MQYTLKLTIGDRPVMLTLAKWMKFLPQKHIPKGCLTALRDAAGHNALTPGYAQLICVRHNLPYTGPYEDLVAFIKMLPPTCVPETDDEGSDSDMFQSSPSNDIVPKVKAVYSCITDTGIESDDGSSVCEYTSYLMVLAVAQKIRIAWFYNGQNPHGEIPTRVIHKARKSQMPQVLSGYLLSTHVEEWDKSYFQSVSPRLVTSVSWAIFTGIDLEAELNVTGFYNYDSNDTSASTITETPSRAITNDIRTIRALARANASVS